MQTHELAKYQRAKFKGKFENKNMKFKQNNLIKRSRYRQCYQIAQTVTLEALMANGKRPLKGQIYRMMILLIDHEQANFGILMKNEKQYHP